jgi:hypothetical protein
MALQIKPQYHVEIIPPNQVYLLGEQDSHALTGRLYCQIVPYLDGQYSRNQLVDKLNGKIPVEYIDFALARLEEKGYLVEAASGMSLENAAF